MKAVAKERLMDRESVSPLRKEDRPAKPRSGDDLRPLEKSEGECSPELKPVAISEIKSYKEFMNVL